MAQLARKKEEKESREAVLAGLAQYSMSEGQLDLLSAVASTQQTKKLVTHLEKRRVDAGLL